MVKPSYPLFFSSATTGALRSLVVQFLSLAPCAVGAARGEGKDQHILTLRMAARRLFLSALGSGTSAPAGGPLKDGGGGGGGAPLNLDILTYKHDVAGNENADPVLESRYFKKMGSRTSRFAMTREKRVWGIHSGVYRRPLMRRVREDEIMKEEDGKRAALQARPGLGRRVAKSRPNVKLDLNKPRRQTRHSLDSAVSCAHDGSLA